MRAYVYRVRTLGGTTLEELPEGSSLEDARRLAMSAVAAGYKTVLIQRRTVTGRNWREVDRLGWKARLVTFTKDGDIEEVREKEISVLREDIKRLGLETDGRYTLEELTEFSFPIP